MRAVVCGTLVIALAAFVLSLDAQREIRSERQREEKAQPRPAEWVQFRRPTPYLTRAWGFRTGGCTGNEDGTVTCSPVTTTTIPPLPCFDDFIISLQGVTGQRRWKNFDEFCDHTDTWTACYSGSGATLYRNR